MTPSERLRAWREDRELSLVEAGKLFGAAGTNVLAWEQGKKRPSDARREAIQVLVGIPTSAWDTEEERAVVERAQLVASAAPTRRARKVTATRTKAAPGPKRSVAGAPARRKAAGQG